MTDYEDDDYEDDLDLSTLPDDELVEQMHDDLYDGLLDEICEGTNILLERGWGAEKVLNDALVAGMTIVGIDFRDGILFVPEVLLAANAMKGGMAILKPLLAETGAEPVGKMVIGTVKGDIHDIGKNLVSMMMEGAGFEVVNIGINNPVENYLEALEEHKPDILGMSALLTTTMPYMKVVIDEMVSQGIRDDYIVLVGGAPLNEEFGMAIGADAYCRDAGVAVETALDAIAAIHPNVTALPVDVSDAASVKSAAKTIGADQSPPDLLVICSGIWEQTKVPDFDPEIFRKAMETNFLGSVNAIGSVAPAMAKRGSGHIAIVASVAGYRGLPNAASYAPTKAALINLAECIRPQLTNLGITTSIINPGFVKTRLTDTNKFPMPFIQTAKQAAATIVRGLEREKYEIAFPWQLATALKTLRLMPNRLFFWLVHRFVLG